MSKCTKCGEELILREGGRRGICPMCGSIFVFPTEEDQIASKKEEYKEFWDKARKESENFQRDPIPFYFSGESNAFLEHLNQAFRLADDDVKASLYAECDAYVAQLSLLETIRPLAIAKAKGKQLPVPDDSAKRLAETKVKEAQQELLEAQREMENLQYAVKEAERELSATEAIPMPKGLFKKKAVQERENIVTGAKNKVALAKRALSSAQTADERLKAAQANLEEETKKYEMACGAGEKIKRAMAEAEDFDFIDRYFRYVGNAYHSIDRMKREIPLLEIYEKHSDPFKIYCEIKTASFGTDLAGYQKQTEFYRSMNGAGGLADYYLWKTTADIGGKCRKLNEYRKQLQDIENFFAE